MAYIKSIGIASGEKTPAVSRGTSRKKRDVVTGPSGETISRELANRLLTPAGRQNINPATPRVPVDPNWQIPLKPFALMNQEELGNYQMQLAQNIAKQRELDALNQQAQNIITENLPQTPRVGQGEAPQQLGGFLGIQPFTQGREPTGEEIQAPNLFTSEYWQQQAAPIGEFIQDPNLSTGLGLLSPPQQEGETNLEMALPIGSGLIDDFSRALASGSDDAIKAATKAITSSGDDATRQAALNLNRENYQNILAGISRDGQKYLSSVDDVTDDILRATKGKLPQGWKQGWTQIDEQGNIISKWIAPNSKSFKLAGQAVKGNILKRFGAIKAYILGGYLFNVGMAFNKQGDAIQGLTFSTSAAADMGDVELVEKHKQEIEELTSVVQYLKNFIPVYGYFDKEYQAAKAMLSKAETDAKKAKHNADKYGGTQLYGQTSTEMRRYQQFLDNTRGVI